MSHKLTVYEWPDGSKVELRCRPRPKPGTSVPDVPSLLSIRLKGGVDGMDTQMAFQMKKSSQTTGPGKNHPVFLRTAYQGTMLGHLTEGCRKKLFGLFLDLGLPVGKESYFLLEHDEFDAIPFQGPVFVPDDRFENRFDEAWSQIVVSEGLRYSWRSIIGKPFLGLFPELQHIRSIDGGGSSWRVTWVTHDNELEHANGSSLEEVVDKFLQSQMAMPESKREEWESESVERGVWVHPKPEEVEMYRLLDEPLPFVWDHADLLNWLLERQAGGA